MKLTCLFDSQCVLLLFLLCWTNIFRDFVLDDIHDTSCITTTSTIGIECKAKVSENISPTKGIKGEHTLSNRQVNFILKFIFYDILIFTIIYITIIYITIYVYIVTLARLGRLWFNNISCRLIYMGTYNYLKKY
jgi:hypothetical protein